MKFFYQTILFIFLCSSLGFSQSISYWSIHKERNSILATDKGVSRVSFPKEYLLFNLDLNPLREELFKVNNNILKHTTIISLPNAEGFLEEFEIVEASNFEADLQAQFPEIRAYSGKGITDINATLKISISPQGIQTMIFRTDKENEFIEPYSLDHTVYAVFKSQRQKGNLAWTCSTEDKKIIKDLNLESKSINAAKSSAGELRTMRLAQSCNAEYSNYFGATNVSQVALVLAAFNATLTRCNGVYEKDLALHLNLVAKTTNVIYYVPATDPYTTMANWNRQLQNTLSANLSGVGTTLAVNNASYDIGHMFGRTGGGGNAGCIGCVCVDDTASTTDLNKGAGITSPGDGVPQGDNFDIDYVVHEVGHQLGGNHTFSHNNEGSGVNKEVGSGITIMAYAGITQQDVAAHSIDIYHEATIEQIQNNLATKTCPIINSLAGVNATPVVALVGNYIIPKSTPFVLTGAATDANTSNILTYCWEQNDDGSSATGANSGASITKLIGPNFLSWSPTVSPSRYFPKLSSIIVNSNTTDQIGGDAGFLSEALSSVSRILNFRLTVRDNAPYSSTAPINVGQTAFTDMKVTVNDASGPFLVSSPNTAISWIAGTNQQVTWEVAGTTANGVNAAYVDVFLSTDGGLTYPIQLANKVPNNGATTIAVPNSVGTNNRIMVKGFQHIFFDISNTNFSITTAPATFLVTESSIQSVLACSVNTATYTFDYKALAGFNATTTFSLTGNPSGSTVSFSPTTLNGTDATVTITIGNLNTVPNGSSTMVLTATSGTIIKTIPYYLTIGIADVLLSTPANNATALFTSLSLNWAVNSVAQSYNYQLASDAGFTTIISFGNTLNNSVSISGLVEGTNYFWRVAPISGSCEGNYNSPYKFTTGAVSCTTTASTAIPVAIPTTVATITSTLNIPSGVTIADLNISLNVTHTWINDLKATLKSPAGTVVTLFDRPCDANSSINDIIATFDDSGIVSVCGNNPGISGTVIPTQALTAFNGQNSTGTWTLTIIDGFNQDGGSLNSWNITTCSTTPALGVASATFQNFVLYPNPNNGNFTIQFNSLSNKNITIGIYDMRGREVFNKLFENKGLFNENLNLNTLQAGVYLVNVNDGENKIVKRIIIQ